MIRYFMELDIIKYLQVLVKILILIKHTNNENPKIRLQI